MACIADLADELQPCQINPSPTVAKQQRCFRLGLSHWSHEERWTDSNYKPAPGSYKPAEVALL